MRTLAVCSFKGGTAKTSTALHVGTALAKFHNAKVLLIDFDAQANLTAGLGFDPDQHDSLAAVLQGEKTIDEVIQKDAPCGVHMIPADTWLERVEVSGPLASDRYSHERLKKLLDGLDYDYVIIDTPPSLCWLTESALIAATDALICSTAEFYSVKGMERLAEFIQAVDQRHSTNVLGVTLSFWNARGKNNPAFLEVIESTFPGKLLKTRVRRDIAVSEAAIFGKPLFETCPTTRASEDYKRLTKELMERMQ